MNRVTKVVVLAATMMTMALVLGACGSSSKDASATPTKATGATITIKNFMFGAPITVAKGAEVTVKNADSTAHTVTADDMSFNTNSIAPGETATFTVSKAGTIKFHCDIHNYMTGSIQVTA